MRRQATRLDGARSHRPKRPPVRGGLDLGGTKIQAVVTDGAAEVLGAARRDTPQEGGPTAVVRELAGALGDVLAELGLEPSALEGVGVGAPGSVEPSSGVVLKVSNIDGWDAPFPLGPALSAELGVPATIGNDVNAAVMAEHRFGAGRGYDSFLGVFWGTGVGGGIVVDGKMLAGRGSAGEVGHVCTKPGGGSATAGSKVASRRMRGAERSRSMPARSRRNAAPSSSRSWRRRAAIG